MSEKPILSDADRVFVEALPNVRALLRWYEDELAKPVGGINLKEHLRQKDELIERLKLDRWWGVFMAGLSAGHDLEHAKMMADDAMKIFSK